MDKAISGFGSVFVHCSESNTEVKYQGCILQRILTLILSQLSLFSITKVRMIPNFCNGNKIYAPLSINILPLSPTLLREFKNDLVFTKMDIIASELKDPI